MTNQEASKIIKDGLEDMSLDFADEEQYEALTMAIKALEIELSGDAISRQAVLDAIEELKKIHFDRVVVLNKVRDRVLDLPSVNPQEKTGKWIKDNPFLKPYCSECGKSCIGLHGFDYTVSEYCPNCGARMESEGEEC